MKRGKISVVTEDVPEETEVPTTPTEEKEEETTTTTETVPERKIVYGFPYEYLSPEERARRAADGGESDEEPQKTTVGNVPMEWYADLPHIGYDLDGKPVMKAPGWEQRANVIEEFLNAKDDPDHWRKVYDARTDTEVRLSDDDMRLVAAVMNAKRADKMGIRIEGDEKDMFPDDGGIDWPLLPVDPWVAALPIGEQDPSKKRFIRGRQESRVLRRLAQHILKGYIDPDADRKRERELRDAERGGIYRYDVWEKGAADEAPPDPLHPRSEKKRHAPELLPAPRMPRPGHGDSYNPPAEYLPDEAAVQRIRDDPLMNDFEKNDRIAAMPRKYASLRAVPRDDRTVLNVYRRCLQLYLAPRQRPRRRRVLTDDERAARERSDPHNLPSPDELKPFPTSTTLVYRCNAEGILRAVAIDPRGQWLVSGADNAELRVWEAHTARCVAIARFPPHRAPRRPDDESDIEGDDKDDSDRLTSEDYPVRACAWCPLETRRLLAVAAGRKLFLIVPNALTGEDDAATRDAAEFIDRMVRTLPKETPKPAAAAAADGTQQEGGGAEAAVVAQQQQQQQEEEQGKKKNKNKKKKGSRNDVQEDEADDEEEAAGAGDEEGGGSGMVVPPSAQEERAQKKKPRVMLKKERTAGTTWRRLNAEEVGCLRGLVDPAAVHAVVVEHRRDVATLSWHRGGDYLLVVTQNDPAHPVSQTAAIVHRVSTHASQKLRITARAGPIQTACFHPTKPCVVVATQRSVRIYDVSKNRERALVKKLVPHVRWISTVAVHPEGNNVLMGSFDKRVCWFDLDYSSKPYKTMRHSKRAVRRVAFHPRLPLFATASDENRTYVFHDTVSDDLLTDPLIVPLRILHGHGVREGFGILDLAFHPTLPWLFTAGADGNIVLHTDKDLRPSSAAAASKKQQKKHAAAAAAAAAAASDAAAAETKATA